MKTLALSILLGALFIAPATYAHRDEGNAKWELPGDVLGTLNQISFKQGADDVWYFMESHTIAHNPSTYRFIPEYDAPAIFLGGGFTPAGFSCWHSPSILPDVCVNFNSTPVTLENFNVPPGSVYMHPGEDRFSIVAWKSPITGNVKIHGLFADIDANCGNGVTATIDKGSATLLTLVVENGTTQNFSLKHIHVHKGEVLYFIVDPRGEFSCDSTRLEVTITSTGLY
ncbi:hypothetical protein [Nitrospira sp. BLG_1]|uniref:hypothetical protein n=1 Tax=Nitrospira sp. BLG_1 TaxID=3395883 RepID=UPI0039BC3249